MPMQTDKNNVFHKHMVQNIVEALSLIFLQSAKADRVVDGFLKSQRKWGSRDRKFFAESVYEIVRTARWLAQGVGINNSPLTWNLSDLWRLWGARVLSQGIALPAWSEVEGLHWVTPEDSVSRAVKYSLSDELDEIGLAECGSSWESLLAALNRPAEVYLRTNLITTNPTNLKAKLSDEGFLTELVDPEKPALRLLVRKNLAATNSFKEGLFEIQDLASQEVSVRVNPLPGETIVDACAGGGGKSLHLASLMKNQGRLISMDVSKAKLLALQTRARRNKINIIETVLLEGGSAGGPDSSAKSNPEKALEKFYERADRVLLDVPCSGSGVLRRNPDAKWKINREKLLEVKKLQKKILREYSRMVKPGGLLVYSTCSVFPSENQDQIRSFVADSNEKSIGPNHLAWEIVSEETCDPRLKSWDGFYIAVIKRN
jgi:16S rRNA (cytosine967-C5)-methyltransferase